MENTLVLAEHLKVGMTILDHNNTPIVIQTITRVTVNGQECAQINGTENRAYGYRNRVVKP